MTKLEEAFIKVQWFEKYFQRKSAVKKACLFERICLDLLWRATTIFFFEQVEQCLYLSFIFWIFWWIFTFWIWWAFTSIVAFITLIPQMRCLLHLKIKWIWIFKTARFLIRGKSASIFYAICYFTPLLWQGFILCSQYTNASAQFSIFRTNAIFHLTFFFIDFFKQIQFQIVHKLLLDMDKNFVIRRLFKCKFF